jgi:hypothetical protein
MTMEKESKKILKLFNNKGWNIYYSGNNEERLSAEEEIKKGPTKSLGINNKYSILPKVNNPNDLSLIHATIGKYQLSPRVHVPIDGTGRRVIHFPSGDHQEIVRGGEKLDALFGFQLLKDEVYLFLSDAVYMSYETFIKTLDSLNDISSFKPLENITLT